MDLPRKVTVEDVEYTIRGMPRDEKYKGLYGLIFMENEGSEIMVNKNLSDRQQALTLLHEIIHAALNPLGLNFRHDERVTRRLEEGLASAMEENPTFFRDLITLLRRTRRGTRSR